MDKKKSKDRFPLGNSPRGERNNNADERTRLMEATYASGTRVSELQNPEGMQDNQCFKLCDGRVHCCVNAMCCPFVFSYHGCRIYCCKCMGVSCGWFWQQLCCCCKCCQYVDEDFQGSRAIGNVTGDDAQDIDFGKHRSNGKKEKPTAISSMAGWIRLGGIVLQRNRKTTLFGKGIKPSDVCQGTIGDCWLMSAMSCLAEDPSAISALFERTFKDTRGKYHVRIFDGAAARDPKTKRAIGAWVTVQIDDMVPCDKGGNPIFARIIDGETQIWPLLVEKAVAKLCGSYAALEGGNTVWGLRCLTGDDALVWQRDPETGTWRGSEFINDFDPNDKRKAHVEYFKSTELGASLTDDEMWNCCLNFHKILSTIAASGVKSGTNLGLKQGHAYSVISLYDGGKPETRLVQIRNPWGTGVWKGAWSAGSKQWRDHPMMEAKLCRHMATGCFWMSWDDFCKHWSMVQVLVREVDIHSLQMRWNERICCGSLWGCLGGCLGEYMCCCLGIERLYFPQGRGKGPDAVRKVDGDAQEYIDTRKKDRCIRGCTKACWARVGCWFFWWIVMLFGITALILFTIPPTAAHMKNFFSGNGWVP